MDVFLMQKSSSILSQTSLNALFVNIPLNPYEPPYYTKLHIPVCKRNCNIKILTSNQFSFFIIFNNDCIYILSAYSVADAEWSKQTPLCARYTVCRCCSITNLCCSIPKRSLSICSLSLSTESLCLSISSFWVSMSNTFSSKEERRAFFAGGISAVEGSSCGDADYKW